MYGLELEGLSLAEVTELARSLAAQIAVLQAQLVDCARAIEARSGELGGDTPRQFVAFECGLTEDEAHRVCRLADRLEGLPRLADAFREGRLSEGTVSLLLRVATRENESHLLDVAEAATATQLRTIVREYQRVRESEADSTDLDTESRPDRLSRGWAADGRYRLSGDFSPYVGAQIDTMLDAARDILWKDTADEREATVKRLDDGVRHSERAGVTDADALAYVAESFLGALGGDESVLPDRFHILLRADADALLSGNLTDDCLHLANGPAVSLGCARQLACEGAMSALLQHSGRPVASSPARSATPAQRRVLFDRDRRCLFPGCGRTKHLVPHHVVEHQHGGATSLDNLALLCPTHHRTIHRNGWATSMPEPGKLVITRPDGSVVGVRQRPRSETDPLPEPMPDMPADRRLTGTGDRLTPWALDVILADWLSVA
jgi:hypothetical protein